MKRIGERLTITRHGEDRRIQMGLTTEQVREVIEEAEVSYTNTSGDGRTTHQFRNLAVVTGKMHDGVTDTVITVLWREVEDWKRGEGPPS